MFQHSWIEGFEIWGFPLSSNLRSPPATVQGLMFLSNSAAISMILTENWIISGKLEDSWWWHDIAIEFEAYGLRLSPIERWVSSLCAQGQKSVTPRNRMFETKKKDEPIDLTEFIWSLVENNGLGTFFYRPPILGLPQVTLQLLPWRLSVQPTVRGTIWLSQRHSAGNGCQRRTELYIWWPNKMKCVVKKKNPGKWRCLKARITWEMADSSWITFQRAFPRSK